MLTLSESSALVALVLIPLISGVVLEGEYRNSTKKCALKRIQKVGNQLSREFQILEMIKGMDNVVQMEVTNSLIQHIFYSKDDTNTKLIQNIVFEFLESNLEHLIEETVKAKSFIKESLIKVILTNKSEIRIPTFERSQKHSQVQHCTQGSQAGKCAALIKGRS
jgi:hypothetical protein